MPDISHQQAEALRALEWLFDEGDDARGQGRSYVMALAYLRHALRRNRGVQPGTPTVWMHVTDHTHVLLGASLINCHRIILGDIQRLVAEAGLTVEVRESSGTFRITGLTAQDPMTPWRYLFDEVRTEPLVGPELEQAVADVRRSMREHTELEHTERERQARRDAYFGQPTAPSRSFPAWRAMEEHLRDFMGEEPPVGEQQEQARPEQVAEYVRDSVAAGLEFFVPGGRPRVTAGGEELRRRMIAEGLVDPNTGEAIPAVPRWVSDGIEGPRQRVNPEAARDAREREDAQALVGQLSVGMMRPVERQGPPLRETVLDHVQRHPGSTPRELYRFIVDAEVDLSLSQSQVTSLLNQEVRAGRLRQERGREPGWGTMRYYPLPPPPPPEPEPARTAWERLDDDLV